MPLPKELTAALDAWKKGEGEFPEALNHGSFFENDGAFQRAINGKLGPAQKQARAEAEAQILETLGITDPEELKAMKTKLAEAAGTLTEVEKLRAEKAKWEREHGKTAEKLKDLEGFKTTVLKGRALDPHLVKIAEPFRALVRENLEGKLKIEGDKVLAPEGAEVAAFIEEFVKANPSLKAPEFKEGAGTGPNGGKSKTNSTQGTGGNVGAGAGGNGGTSNGNGADPKFPKTFGAALVAVMKENDAKGEGAQ